MRNLASRHSRLRRYLDGQRIWRIAGDAAECSATCIHREDHKGIFVTQFMQFLMGWWYCRGGCATGVASVSVGAGALSEKGNRS